MTTQQYLGQIDRLTFMIETKNEEIMRLTALACKITTSTDGFRVKSSPEPDKLANAVAKIVEAKNELAELVTSLCSKRAEIIEKIDNMQETTCQKFLTCRYVKNLAGKEICAELGISPASLFRIQKAAIKEFERQYGTDFKKITITNNKIDSE